MTRLMLILALTAAHAGHAAAGSSPVKLAKVAVTPVQLSEGIHRGKTRFRVEFTATRTPRLMSHEHLTLEMVCRAGASNRKHTLTVYVVNKATIGHPQAHKHYLFGVRPFARRPTRCTLAFTLRSGLSRRSRPLASFCYTGEKKLLAKACTKMQPPIVVGQRPQPIDIAR